MTVIRLRATFSQRFKDQFASLKMLDFFPHKSKLIQHEHTVDIRIYMCSPLFKQ